MPPTAPTARFVPTNPQHQIAAAVAGRNERGAEDNILRLENFLPGLGGVYVDGENLVVYVPPATVRKDAIAKLALGAATLDLEPKTRRQMIYGENIVLRPARHSFSQLVAWSEGGAGGIMLLPGVIGIDANEGTNRLTILVRDLSVVPSVFATAKTAGLPEDAIETRVSRVSFAGGLRERYRPTAGGIQIDNGYVGNGSTCTLGFNVTINDGEKGFYTASHCVSPTNYGIGLTGVGINQPYTVEDEGRIGTVTINPPWNSSVTLCLSNPRCADVDAMYVKYDNPSDWSSRVAIMSGLATLYAGDSAIYIGSRTGWWTNINLSPTSYSYWQGIDVDKVGRTTGWTRGKLDGTCVAITVDSAQSPTQFARILCTDVVKGAYAGNGDSGSPVFVGHDGSNSELKALGVLSSVDYIHGFAITGEGAPFCNNAECRYYYTRLQRIGLFVYQPY